MEKKEKLEIQISRLKKIREDLGMNRTEFSHYVDIPLRTLEEWEAGRRQMPDYEMKMHIFHWLILPNIKIPILHLNLLHGFLQSLSCILSKIISG